MRCAGKRGVVTGTSRGLGREILLALCGEGASVVGLARDAEAGGEAAEEANRTEGQAVFAQGDVRREQDVVDAIARCKEEFGGFDFIVNNAGILGEGRLHETSNDCGTTSSRRTDRGVLGLQARDRDDARRRHRRARS